MTYEERIKPVLDIVERGEWDGSEQVHLNDNDGKLVKQIERDGYIKFLGNKPAEHKDGVTLLGEVVLTRAGKELLDTLK